MSVGPGGDIEVSKSLPETFFDLIGSEPGQSRSLYRMCWLSWRSNFLYFCDDERSGSSGITVFPDIRGTDVEKDF